MGIFRQEHAENRCCNPMRLKREVFPQFLEASANRLVTTEPGWLGSAEKRGTLPKQDATSAVFVRSWIAEN